jgi:hypothetical protein
MILKRLTWPSGRQHHSNDATLFTNRVAPQSNPRARVSECHEVNSQLDWNHSKPRLPPKSNVHGHQAQLTVSVLSLMLPDLRLQPL